MSVVVATAYMEEAARFDWLVAMDAGRVLATGRPAELLSRTGTRSLEAAFVALLPEEKLSGHREGGDPPAHSGRRGGGQVAIEARDLTQCFGSFVAVDHVNIRIECGEIFGFLGSNGSGKTTTMKGRTQEREIYARLQSIRTLCGEPGTTVVFARPIGFLKAIRAHTLPMEVVHSFPNQ